MTTALEVVLPNITEDDITRLGFSVKEFVAQYDITSLNERVQVREDRHLAPAERVREYAARMKTEPCPAILVTEDGRYVDGNTRGAAAKRNKQQFLPAYVLNVSWESATAKEKDYLKALAAKANRHGMVLDKKEKREVVKLLVQQDWNADAIGAFVGSTPSVVTQVKQEIAGAAKLDRVGIKNGAIKGANLRALGKISDVNDAPFKEIANLAADAGLNATEITALGKTVKAAGSDEAALALVASERTARTDGIRDLDLTGSPKPPLARKLRQALGFVVNHSNDDPRTMVEFSESYVEDHIKMLEESIAALQAVLTAQRAEA